MLIFSSCIDKRDRSHHVANEAICEGMFTSEMFRVFGGGVHAGDIHALWVTDSMSFRTYLGSTDDDEYYLLRCTANGLLVEKWDASNRREPILVSGSNMNLDSLRLVDPLRSSPVGP